MRIIARRRLMQLAATHGDCVEQVADWYRIASKNVWHNLVEVRTALQTLLGEAGEEYLTLVRAFPLVHIRDDAHLDAAVAVIDRLVAAPARSEAEEAYLGALTDLVETYESENVTIPPRSGLDALRFLMATNNLKQIDLVPVLGSKSLVSELLAGRRPLALSHVKKLAAYFGVAADTFIE